MKLPTAENTLETFNAQLKEIETAFQTAQAGTSPRLRRLELQIVLESARVAYETSIQPAQLVMQTAAMNVSERDPEEYQEIARWYFDAIEPACMRYQAFRAQVEVALSAVPAKEPMRFMSTDQ